MVPIDQRWCLVPSRPFPGMIIKINGRRYMAKILPIRRKTPSNQSINQNHRYHSYVYCLLCTCTLKVYTCPGIETFLWNYIPNYVVYEHQMQFKIQGHFGLVKTN